MKLLKTVSSYYNLTYYASFELFGLNLILYSFNSKGEKVEAEVFKIKADRSENFDERLSKFLFSDQNVLDISTYEDYSNPTTELDFDELDNMFVECARLVVLNQEASASVLQRKFKLGYNRAGHIIDQLEAMGIIGPFKGSSARDILFTNASELQEFLKLKGFL